MLIGFVGAPNSGKTTTAALLFADLKVMGLTTEFVPEEARKVIADLRYRKGDKFELQLQDQLRILRQQEEAECLFTDTAPSHVVVVTDSCVANTLLYLNDSVKPDISQSLKRYDLIFICRSVPFSGFSDPNRVHSEELSKALDLKVENMAECFPNTDTLWGSIEERRKRVLTKVLEVMSR